jgi:hypothetical protein
MDALRQRAQQWLTDEDISGLESEDLCIMAVAVIRDLLAALEAQQGRTCGTCGRCAVSTDRTDPTNRTLYCMEHGWPRVQAENHCSWWEPVCVEDAE